LTQVFDTIETCVDATLERIGQRVVLGLPLGIGKPNLVANEFFRRATGDPTLKLTILTALSLARPRPRNDLERRLLEPIVERVFADYPELEYVQAAKRGKLPPNVEVIEFYFEPGAWLGVESAQQNYLSSNYTHVGRDFLARGANVIAQLVARRAVGSDTQLSLGSNPDILADLLPDIAAARAAGRDIVLIGAVHPRMPFMFGGACIDPERFDYLIDHPNYDYELFCPPNPPLRTVDHAIAMHVSAQIRDGGTLQIGIGELGDALVYALLLRHQQHEAWRAALTALGGAGEDLAPFRDGLYACTEMLVDQMLDLMRAGILRRHVYGSLPLMRLLASGRIGERFDGTILEALRDVGVGPRLEACEFEELRRHGVFRSDTRFRDGRIRSPDGAWITADLADDAARRALAAECIGRELRGGVVAHASFFVGPRGFYAKLREMPERELRRIDMCGVGYVNQLYGTDYELRCLQRRHARFVNTTMMVTLLGAAVSDTLADGRVVSGVGGQYNFVAMAHALPDARAIVCVRATREKAGRVTSNIVWNYPQATIARHLRDIVVTEYGVADLRSATDSEVIQRLLNIADSRFQDELLAAAQAAGKVARDYRIPAQHRHNTPGRIASVFAIPRSAGLFTEYPFGTDLTSEEIRLAQALTALAAQTTTARGRAGTFIAALRGGIEPGAQQALARMGLAHPRGWRERLARRLVALALRRLSVRTTARDPGKP
jgi:acyl-CoA hydrolase